MSGLPQKDSDRPTEAALLRVLEEVAEVRGLRGSDSDPPMEDALHQVLDGEQAPIRGILFTDPKKPYCLECWK